MEDLALAPLLRKEIGTNYCIPVGSGTTGLLLALKAFNFPKNSEIIIPDYTCINVGLAIIFAELKPVVVDVRKEDYNIDIELINTKINRKTRAIIGVHSFGSSFAIDEVKEICKDNNLKFIEDFCQSFGGKYKGKPHGSFGEISVASFGKHKTLDVGSGGAIFTDNRDLYLKLINLLESEDIIEKFMPVLENLKVSKINKFSNFFKRRKICLDKLVPFLFKFIYNFRGQDFGYSLGMKEEQLILDKMKNFEMIKEYTILQGKFYQNFLINKHFKHLHKQSDEIICRYPLFINKRFKGDVVKILKNKFIFFKNFPHNELPISRYFLQSTKSPISNTIYSGLLILPTGPQYSFKNIVDIIDTLNKFKESR